MSRHAALELVQVTKRYGETVAVDAIDLKVPAGTYCCFLGPSGCGKSSTLRMIAGHEIASSGDIVLGGANITDLQPSRRGTAMMFQSYALFPHLTVLDNIAFSLKMKGVAKAERHAKAMKVMDLVDLGAFAARMPAQLSGGQQQRVAIARALAMEPAVLLCDEITSALDPELVGEVLRVVESLADEGMTLLMVTHEMSFARKVGDRVIFMHQGRVHEMGPPAELFGNPQTAELKQFLSSLHD